MVNEEQPGTQEIDSCCDYGLSSPVEDNGNVWGRLYPILEKLPPLDLINEEYVVGRAPDCAVVFKEDIVRKTVLLTFSKQHFKIGKQESSSHNVPFIEDLSFNGTYVNGDKLGKGTRRVLKNNDQISLSMPHWKAYIYVDATGDCGEFPEEITKKYVVLRELGSGACGKVHLVFAKKTLTKRYAMKVVSKKKFSVDGKKVFNDPKYIDNEVSILKALDHPCIIRIEEVIDTPDAVYIILELMEGGELFDRIQRSERLGEQDAKLIFYQIVQAVKYLHSNDITHRDLKPENILLSSNDTETLVKVSDFGLSKIVDSQSMLKTFCGTPIYVAPEILVNCGAGTYTMQNYAFSPVPVDKLVKMPSNESETCSCLGGYPPFSKDRKMPLDQQILNGNYSFPDPIWKSVSAEAICLIKQMLTVDPEKRIKIDDILRHKWLQDKNIIKKAKDLMKINVDVENMAPPVRSPPLKRKRFETDVTVDNN